MAQAPPNPLDMSDAQLTSYYDDMGAEDDARRAKLDAPDALAKAARWYARNGVLVFPLVPGEKRPVIRSVHRLPDGKTDTVAQKECAGRCGQDGHGLYDGTLDIGKVDGWWTRWPQANIGLPTGHLFDVIDIDGPQGVRSYADKLVHGKCPDDCSETEHCPGDGVTLAEVTGPAGVLARALTRGTNGGLHLYVAPTGESNSGSILPGIDYRGLGGYVVAPPSRAHLGRYAWIDPLQPATLAAL